MVEVIALQQLPEERSTAVAAPESWASIAICGGDPSNTTWYLCQR